MMKQALMGMLVGTAMAAIAAPASATTTIGSTDVITLNDIGGGFLLGKFDFDHPTATTGVEGGGAFLKQYTFTVPTAGLASGSIQTSLVGTKGIEFVSVLLNGKPFSITDGIVGSIKNIDALANNTLDIYYNNTFTGSPAFSGQVSFTGAVPEPSTWGLMIMGIGFVGFAMRKRNNQNVRAKIRFA
jgi:hypothetical protein